MNEYQQTGRPQRRESSGAPGYQKHADGDGREEAEIVEAPCEAGRAEEVLENPVRQIAAGKVLILDGAVGYESVPGKEAHVVHQSGVAGQWPTDRRHHDCQHRQNQSAATKQLESLGSYVAVSEG